MRLTNFISLYQQEFLAKDGCYYMANIGVNKFNRLSFSLSKTIDASGYRIPPIDIKNIYYEVVKQNMEFKSVASIKGYVFKSYYKVDEMEGE